MTERRNEALLYMNKAMTILDLEPASPSICHLQMAIDLLLEEGAIADEPIAGPVSAPLRIINS